MPHFFVRVDRCTLTEGTLGMHYGSRTYLMFPCSPHVAFQSSGAVGGEEGVEGPLWLLCSAESPLCCSCSFPSASYSLAGDLPRLRSVPATAELPL